MLKHHFLKRYGSDIVSRAGSRIAAVVGTYKEILTAFEPVGGAVVELRPAIRTEYLARKDGDFLSCRRSAPVLSYLLCRVKGEFVHDGGVGVLIVPAKS